MKLQIFKARMGKLLEDPYDDYYDQTFEGVAPLPNAYLESWTVRHMYYDRDVLVSAWFINLDSLEELAELLSTFKDELIFYPKGRSPFEWTDGSPVSPTADFALRIYDDYIE